MTTPPDIALPDAAADPLLLERLRAAAELLETVAADMSLLDAVPTEDRHRLQRAVAQVYHPDPVARRHRLKTAERERIAAKIRSEEAVLENTGIRALRRKPVFTTPNVFPPKNFQPQDVADDHGRRETHEPQHCYVWIQTEASFDAMSDRYIAPHSPFGEGGRDMRRLINASAFDDGLDSAGRVKVPKLLKDHAGLDGNCIVIGAGDYLEIWNGDAWEKKSEELDREAATIAEGISRSSE